MENVSNPTFIIEIEGDTLSQDISSQIKALSFTDNEKGMDELEIVVVNREGQFTDNPLFQEGNEAVVRFGYIGNLSARKKATIKEIHYEFPEGGMPSMRLKAFDKGHKLAGGQVQKTWQKPAPGILYSEIAEAIAKKHDLKAVVTPTKVRRLRVEQGNISDAQFLRELAKKARGRDGDGVSGYVFYVQDDELHFHPRALDEAPVYAFEYFAAKQGMLKSFRPKTKSQGVKAAGTEARAAGVDPRKKAPVEHKANKDTTPERDVLGEQTYLVNANTGEGEYKEAGETKPSFERSTGFHEEPSQEPAQDEAEGRFKEAELGQVEATAQIIGIPNLRAKKNVEIKGVGKKFSGVYYCEAVRHTISESGYTCDLKLKRNALGKGAGKKAEESDGTKNDQETKPEKPEANLVQIDANTGEIREVAR